MTQVVFWEKPGCINNTRQKQLLRAAGHELDARNLLTERWTAESLRPFFGALPVEQWFNRAAPAVKNGEVIPERLTEMQALTQMIADPLLIRRPLMQVGSRRMVGFNPIEVDAWIGLQETALEGLEQCPREHEAPANPCRASG